MSLVSTPIFTPIPAMSAAVHKLLKLSDLAIGASAVVREMPKSAGAGAGANAGGGGGVALRLREMGVLPGVRITLARIAPLGDPLAIKVRGSVLTLRKRDAAHVLVEAAA